MNERIRELAEQSRKYARDYVAECKHYGHYMEHNEYELRFEEKFAELIVKECVEQASISNGHGNNQWDKALTFAADNIKKHFGVEE